jgi:uncharacterized membrane protein YkvA (DUF1232 family)
MPTTKHVRRPRRAHSHDTDSSHASASTRATRRRRAEATLFDAVRDIPNFFRLLYGLMTDPRVDPLDKILVGAAIGYVLMPEDLIPDFLPIVGEIDDVFVLTLAIRRLLRNTSREVIRDHWMGDPADLRNLDLERVLAAGAFFLPKSMRRRLRTIGRV